MKRLLYAMVAATLVAFAGSSYAHDGHDHGPGGGGARHGHGHAGHSHGHHGHRGSFGFGLDRHGFGFGFERRGFSFHFHRGFDHGGHGCPGDSWGGGHGRFHGHGSHYGRSHYDRYTPHWRW